MSDYTKSGKPLDGARNIAKVIRDEFTLIETATNSKSNKSGSTYTGTHDFTGATISSGQLDAKAPLASPALTGVPTAPTATAGTNTTQLATTAHTFAERSNSATLTNKTLTAPVINSPTGIVKGDVGLGNVDNTTDAGKPISTATQTALDLKSPLASPTFTGVPAAPTAAPGTNTTQLATTAFVDAKAFSTALPSQTGNNGKFVTTDGSVASWASAAILSANTFTGAQILSDQQVIRAMLIDCGLTYLDKGNSGTSTQDLTYTGGSHQKITATGNFTITTSAWPPTGNLGVILLEAANFGAYTVTWPTISWVKPNGTTTTSVSTWLAAVTGRTAFQSSGTDFIKLWTRDAGTTIYGGFAA